MSCKETSWRSVPNANGFLNHSNQTFYSFSFSVMKDTAKTQNHDFPQFFFVKLLIKRHVPRIHLNCLLFSPIYNYNVFFIHSYTFPSSLPLNKQYLQRKKPLSVGLVPYFSSNLSTCTSQLI